MIQYVLFYFIFDQEGWAEFVLQQMHSYRTGYGTWVLKAGAECLARFVIFLYLFCDKLGFDLNPVQLLVLNI